MFRQTLLIVSLLLTTGATAAEPAMSDTDASAIQLSLNRGFEIFRYDQAAWHTTDTMLEDVKDPRGKGISGWVVTAADDGLLTTFWKKDGDGFRGVYSAIWTGSSVTHRQLLEGSDSNLGTQQIELIRARLAVDTSKLERCSDKPFNSVILPAEKPGDPILVYMLTPQTSANSIPMGGHYRFAVVDGKTVEQRAFTKSCIELPFGKSDRKNGKPEAMFITHVLDPIPTEIHVFSVFATKAPIYVGTSSNDHVWVTEISQGQPRVRLIK